MARSDRNFQLSIGVFVTLYLVSLLAHGAVATFEFVEGLGASAVSPDGRHVAGRMGANAAVWSKETGVQLIPLFDGYGTGYARDVSNTAVVVGFQRKPTPLGEIAPAMIAIPFKWSPQSGLAWLSGFSFANAISADGSKVAGIKERWSLYEPYAGGYVGGSIRRGGTDPYFGDHNGRNISQPAGELPWAEASKFCVDVDGPPLDGGPGYWQCVRWEVQEMSASGAVMIGKRTTVSGNYRQLSIQETFGSTPFRVRNNEYAELLFAPKTTLTAVSGNGQVIAGYQEPLDSPRPHIYTDRSPFLWIGDNFRTLDAINDGTPTALSFNGNLVFGWTHYLEEADQRPWIWMRVIGKQDLNELLRDSYNLDLTGWDLDTAVDMSDDGTVLVVHASPPANSEYDKPGTLVIELDVPPNTVDLLPPGRQPDRWQPDRIWIPFQR